MPEDVATQHVMVHIDASLGPIGAWSYINGDLMHFYPEALDVAIAARAREAMAQRDLSISVPDWFTFVTGHYCNALDEFTTMAIDEPLSLPAILAEYRRSWFSTPTD